jgi:hypothetical protein
MSKFDLGAIASAIVFVAEAMTGRQIKSKSIHFLVENVKENCKA